MIRCLLKNVPISPKKLVMPAKIIRGKRVVDAIAILTHQISKACRLLLAALKSAIANMKCKTEDKEFKIEDVFVLEILTSRGSADRKMYDPKAKGSCGIKTKYTAHITVVIGELNGK